MRKLDKNSKLYLILRKLYIYYNFDVRRLFSIINLVVLFLPNIYLRKNGCYVIVRNNTSIGDNLIWTSILEKSPIKKKILLIHQSEEIFRNIHVKKKFLRKNTINNFLINFLIESPHSNIIGRAISGPKKEISMKKMHLRNCAIVHKKEFYDINKKVQKNPVIIFNKKELNKYNKKYKNIIGINYGLIISENNDSGLSRVKNWGWKNFQYIVDKTQKDIKWIQVGLNKDKKLKNTFKDFRGKTTIRELFYLVSKSKIVVTSEGALTHISAAFNIPCITTYSGYHYPEVSLYKNIIPIVPKPLPSCAYCWQSVCKINSENPPCLENMHKEEAVDDVRMILKNYKKYRDKKAELLNFYEEILTENE